LDYGACTYLFFSEDIIKKNEELYITTRDNIVFEAGMFVSRLGIKRCYIIIPESPDIPGLADHLASDLRVLPIPANTPGGCTFDVMVAFSGKGGEIDLPGNRFVFTSPGLNATVTNQSTAKYVTLNVTGAFHVSTQTNGNVVTVVTGRNLLVDPIAGFVLAIGTFSYVFDSTGTILIQPLIGTGQLIDVCKLIS
jgi:Predicted nucleotide-binding protein containing TIR-like domain